MLLSRVVHCIVRSPGICKQGLPTRTSHPFFTNSTTAAATTTTTTTAVATNTTLSLPSAI
jgi:hypothetical protein